MKTKERLIAGAHDLEISMEGDAVTMRTPAGQRVYLGIDTDPGLAAIAIALVAIYDAIRDLKETKP